MKNLPSILTIFLSTIIAQPELNIPDNISFQGFLTQSDGVAYADGEYEITFKLIIPTDNGYETTIWQEMHSIEFIMVFLILIWEI